MDLKLFAIGNSFSMNALRFLPKMAESAGDIHLTLAQAYIGGCPIEKHLNLARLHESDPANPDGMPYEIDGVKYGLKELLLKEDWDLITLQQFSGYSFKIDTYRPCAKELLDYVRRYRPLAEVGMHQTWAYRRDNTSVFNAGFTMEDMYRGLEFSYRTIASELGLKRIIPVGNAFQLVDETPGQTFVIDPSFAPATAEKGKLPQQEPSLHVGWFLGADGVAHYDHGHANVRGEFLGACVWFESLFQRDVRQNDFKPLALSKEDAAFLRGVAHRAVSEGEQPKALEFKTR